MRLKYLELMVWIAYYWVLCGCDICCRYICTGSLQYFNRPGRYMKPLRRAGPRRTALIAVSRVHKPRSKHDSSPLQCGTRGGADCWLYFEASRPTLVSAVSRTPVNASIDVFPMHGNLICYWCINCQGPFKGFPIYGFTATFIPWPVKAETFSWGPRVTRNPSEGLARDRFKCDSW